MANPKPPRYDYGYKLQHELAQAISEVRDKTVLPRTHSELLKDLARHANKNTGHIWVATRTMAAELRVTDVNVRSYLKALIAQGILEVVEEARQHKSRVLHINLDAIRALKSSPQRPGWGKERVRQTDHPVDGLESAQTDYPVDALEPESRPSISGSQTVHSQNPDRPLSGPRASTQWTPKGESKSKDGTKGEGLTTFPSAPLRSPLIGGADSPPATADADDAMELCTPHSYAEWLVKTNSCSLDQIVAALRTAPVGRGLSEDEREHIAERALARG
jgi:hypothetical protein